MRTRKSVGGRSQKRKQSDEAGLELVKATDRLSLFLQRPFFKPTNSPRAFDTLAVSGRAPRGRSSGSGGSGSCCSCCRRRSNVFGERRRRLLRGRCVDEHRCRIGVEEEDKERGQGRNRCGNTTSRQRRRRTSHVCSKIQKRKKVRGRERRGQGMNLPSFLPSVV